MRCTGNSDYGDAGCDTLVSISVAPKLQGSMMLAALIPGFALLTRGYCPPPLPGRGTRVVDGPGAAEETAGGEQRECPGREC